MMEKLIEIASSASFLDIFLAVFAGVSGALTIFFGGMKVGRLVSSRTIKRRMAETAQTIQAEKDRSQHMEQRFSDIQKVLDGEVNIWLREAKYDVGEYVKRLSKSKPVITICNFKGGVGKTTVASNLAAYFDRHLEKRVLLIDFDYQGSLTDTVGAAAQLENLEASAKHLIEGTKSFEAALSKAASLHPALSRTKLFACFYGFNKVENQMLLRWITHKDETEIRFNTHDYLSSEAFQEAFDVVIIDAPPRLMTGTINAALASTHLLIPTVLDGLSTSAALNTLGAFHELRKELSPTLQVLGVVPTLVREAGGLNRREQEALDLLRDQMQHYWQSAPRPHIFEDTWICRRESIAKVAGQGIAFEADPEVRAMFIALGDAISQRIFVDEGTRPPIADGTAAGNVTQFADRRRA